MTRTEQAQFAFRTNLVNGSQIHWSKHDHGSTGSAEISDFGPKFDFGPIEMPSGKSVLGMTVKSDKTGKEVAFALRNASRDKDGDVMSWSLNPVTPGFDRVNLIIFND